MIKRHLSRPYTRVDIVAAVVAVAVGALIFNADAPIADKLIGLFGVIVVVLRVDSRLSFGLALVCLIQVPALSAMGRGKLSESFAVYTFYFLIIGAVELLLEDQPEKEYWAIRQKQFESIAHNYRRPAAVVATTGKTQVNTVKSKKTKLISG